MGRPFLVITRLADDDQRLVELPPDRDLEGWNHLVRGWSILWSRGGPAGGASPRKGPAASAPRIVLEEPGLAGLRLGVFPASNHVLLWGRREHGVALPPLAVQIDGWTPVDQPDPDLVRVRFDWWPLRIGGHVVQFRTALPEP